METKDSIAGLDVHKTMLAVVIRQPGEASAEYIERLFGTTQSEIGHLNSWLERHGVRDVVMESTAQYWRPVWHGLEGRFQLHLTHPVKTKAPRGRKRDFRDARRLADRWHSGDLEESFIPGAEQRGWRSLTRTRVNLKRLITVVRNTVEGLLEQGGIKLTAVASDPFGVSGWAILQRIARGETDAEELAKEARASLRKKKKQLEEALAGKLDAVGRFLLRQRLEEVALLRKQIDEINQVLAVEMKAYTAVLVRLTKIPGVDLAAAQELLAEIGPGAAAFPTAEQFASWVGLCPGSHESAGICYSSRSAKGNRYLRRLLCQIAWASIRNKETFFGGLFARLLPRIERKGAAWAVAHRVGKVVWLLLHKGVEYQEKGSAIPNPKALTRKFRRLVKDLTRAGLNPETLLSQVATANA